MNPDMSAEMSLQEKLAAARQESKVKVEGGFDKIEGKRSDIKEAMGRAVDTVKQGVERFRAWDKKTSIEAVGTVRAIPEMSKIIAKEGVNKVVEGAKDLWERTNDKVDQFRAWDERVTNGVFEATDKAIEDTKQTYRETRDDVTVFFVETGKSINESADRGKNRLIKFWKRVQAVPHDVIGGAYERKAGRMEKEIAERQAKLAKFNEIAQERRGKADALKGTKREVAAALA